MRKLVILVSLAAALVLSGCEGRINLDSAPSGHRPQGLKGSEEIRLIVFEDGTRCALYSAYRGGGLSCDWKGDAEQ